MTLQRNQPGAEFCSIRQRTLAHRPGGDESLIVAGSDETIHVGCGTALLRRGKLLLVRRRQTPFAGFWDLPGGRLEPSEAVPAAASRGVTEEVGLHISSSRLLCLVDEFEAGAEERRLFPVFISDQFEGNPMVQEPAVLSAAEWFDLDRLPQPLTAGTMAAINALTSAWFSL